MARGWQHRIKLRHLFTTEEDHASIQASMNAIADALAKDTWFTTFRGQSKFRNIPEGDDFFSPVEYANKLLERLYDFCDEQRIWIE